MISIRTIFCVCVCILRRLEDSGRCHVWVLGLAPVSIHPCACPAPRLPLPPRGSVPTTCISSAFPTNHRATATFLGDERLWLVEVAVTFIHSTRVGAAQRGNAISSSIYTFKFKLLTKTKKREVNIVWRNLIRLLYTIVYILKNEVLDIFMWAARGPKLAVCGNVRGVGPVLWSRVPQHQSVVSPWAYGWCTRWLLEYCSSDYLPFVDTWILSSIIYNWGWHCWNFCWQHSAPTVHCTTPQQVTN